MRWRCAGLWLQTFLVVTIGCARVPDDAAARYRMVVRARALFEAGEAKAAQRLLERVAKTDRGPETLVNLGIVQRARGKDDAAARSWSAALERDPADERALFHLAALHLAAATQAHSKRHKSDAVDPLVEARLLAERAVGVDTYNAALQRLLADVLAAQGDTAASRARREAERLDPGRGGSVPEVFGFGRIALPALRRPPHFSRTPPRFATTTLPIASTLALPVDLDGNGTADIVLGGSGATLQADSVRAETDVRWLPMNLLEEAVVLAVPGLFDADAVLDVLVLTRAMADSVQGPARVWLVHGGARPRCTALGEAPAPVQGMAAVDADRDGDVDVLFAVQAENGLQLWRNDGAARFTASAGPPPGTNRFGPARGVWTLDVDGDGAEDVLCLDAQQRLRLLGARAGGVFVEITLLSGLGGQRARAAAGADLDDDGDVDLLLGDDDGLWLWNNDGSGHFVRAAAYREVLAAWTTGPERGVPVAAIHVADLDNDGLVDVVTQHFTAAPPVLATATSHAGTVEDTAPNPSRLTPLLDVPPRTNLALWHNEGNALLSDVTPQCTETEIVTGAAALASADFDRDGDLDLVGAGSDSTLLFLWNVGGTVRRAIEIELVHAASPALCYGAHVELYAGTESVSQVARGPRLWLGVGDAREVDVLRIVWPDGAVQSDLDLTLPEHGRLRVSRAAPGS